MNHRIKSALGFAAVAAIISASSAHAQTPASDTIRIGYQKSSTLTAILKTNGELEKALAPLGVRISWHEFTSGLRCWKRSIPAMWISARMLRIRFRCSRRPPAPSSPISRKKPPRRPPRPFWSLRNPRSRRSPTSRARKSPHQGRRQSLPAAGRARQGGAELQGYFAGLPDAGRWAHGFHRRQCRCVGVMGPVPHQRAAAIQCTRPL